MGIELSSTIVRRKVNELLVDKAGDLDVVGGLHEGDTGDSALGDDTCTTAGLSAPCDRLALGFTNWAWLDRRGINLSEQSSDKLIEWCMKKSYQQES